MAYKLIKGEFHIFYPDIPKQGPEPDGDTLKFKPDDPSLVQDLWRSGQPRPGFNGRGMINLRFEGLDALETHFRSAHQNKPLAEASRDFLLDWAGFGGVVFWDDKPNKVQQVENNPVRGYILTNGLDGHGRIVAFVYSGDAPEPDGEVFKLMPDRVDQSFNARSLEAGQSYPLFYLTLPISLARHLGGIADQARAAGKGLYPDDASAPGQDFEVTPANYQDLVIWPKLFRRLHDYFADEFDDLTGFDTWLRADPRDRDDRMLLPEDYDAHFHNVVEVTSPASMRLTVDPKDIVILPDDFTMPETGLPSH
ncbi:thermonuclease family protein [Ruegeria sp.]|uniref:thermonuclease family protein n=1 Tax=Ruegeria sp. TaxID=1879320 RepID=UPI003B00983C